MRLRGRDGRKRRVISCFMVFPNTRKDGVTLECFRGPVGSHSSSLSLAMGPSPSASQPEKRVIQERSTVTHSDWIAFQVVTSQGIIPRRIRVLRSDLSEPLRGTDESFGMGPGFGVKP